MACRRGNGLPGFAVELDQFTLLRGEAVAITGPSGCGKSTLLDLIGLVLRPNRVERFVFCDDGATPCDVAAAWASGRQDHLARARARGIGYVLQTGGLLPFLSVRDNLRLSRDLLGLGPDPAGEERLVTTLGLAPLLGKRPGMLSIGERQRVAIARALAHTPPLVLADEPTAALDPLQSAEVMRLLLALAAELGVGVVVVSHDWDLLARFGLRRIEARPEARPNGTLTHFSDGAEETA